MVAASGARASYRFLEFFTAQIRNPHTRRAYARAATEFFDWLEAKGITQITAIESVHVATYIEQLQRERSAPTTKLRLAALRHLFDWMVISQIMPTNPAAAGAGRVISSGAATPVLDPAEARQIIDAIDTTTHRPPRPRQPDRLMVYSFARIGAAIGMRVEDVYSQDRRYVCCTRRAASTRQRPRHHNLLYLAVHRRRGARERSEGALVRPAAARPAGSPAIPCPGERLGHTRPGRADTRLKPRRQREAGRF